MLTDKIGLLRVVLRLLIDDCRDDDLLSESINTAIVTNLDELIVTFNDLSPKQTAKSLRNHGDPEDCTVEIVSKKSS